MKASDVMTAPVVTVAPETPFKDVVITLIEHDVSGVPVVDATGRVVGVVTEADLVTKEAFSGRRRFLAVLSDLLTGEPWKHKAEGLTAGDVMTRMPVVAAPDDDVGRLARRMLQRGIKRLPVVKDGALVGIVTRQDLLRAFDRSDDDIAHDIRARLASPLFTPEDQAVTFRVADGVVTLEGSVHYESDRAVVEGMVGSVPGVVAVDSALNYLLPDPRPD